MNKSAKEERTGTAVAAAEKRVILSMGGKGGVGKTSVMTGLAEWFVENEIPVTLLDLDTENKARGSLAHFFGEQSPKVNIHTPAGLDAFVDRLADGAPVILADMEQAQQFRKVFEPAVIHMDYRLPDLENASRNHGVTLGQIAGRTTNAPELQKASYVMRAQSYRRRMFAEFDRVKELLLP